MILSKGDILIDRKTLKKYPVVDAIDGHIFLELGHREVKRAIGQFMKHKSRFIILRKGQSLDKDYAFYCNKTNKMIVLKAGTVFLGEV